MPYERSVSSVMEVLANNPFGFRFELVHPVDADEVDQE